MKWMDDVSEKEKYQWDDERTRDILNGKRKGMLPRRGVYEWGKRTNSLWMEPTDKPHLARCIVFTYIASSYHGHQWPQAQSRLSILQLRKNVLCKCERLSVAFLTSGFKLFCHVGKSLVTETYVRIAKYISANWMLVHCWYSWIRASKIT